MYLMLMLLSDGLLAAKKLDTPEASASVLLLIQQQTVNEK